jgi:hypothetical protein
LNRQDSSQYPLEGYAKKHKTEKIEAACQQQQAQTHDQVDLDYREPVNMRHWRALGSRPASIYWLTSELFIVTAVE